jgi:pimeloyl-ACP methyl ester carboxylesterase
MSNAAARTSPARPSWKRVAAEAVTLASLSHAPLPPTPQDLPRGDSHAVLFLPPSFRGDAYTAATRALVAGLGYVAYGWEQGINRGPTSRLIGGAVQRLIRLSDRHGPMSLVGYSLGGLFARLLAARFPARVRHVITVCSPIEQPARSVWIPIEPFLGLWPRVDLRRLAAEVAAPLRVPTTCVYSRDDGIVSWESCRDLKSADVVNIEVSGCHVAMGRNSETWSAVAHALARAVGGGGPMRA